MYTSIWLIDSIKIGNIFVPTKNGAAENGKRAFSLLKLFTCYFRSLHSLKQTKQRMYPWKKVIGSRFGFLFGRPGCRGELFVLGRVTKKDRANSATPLKIHILNLKITPLKRNIIFHPPSFWSSTCYCSRAQGLFWGIINLHDLTIIP